MSGKKLELAKTNTRVRFEQWAKNPECEANTVSAVLNIRSGEVAAKLGYPNTKGTSPFAVARGYQFEKDLFADEASRLRQLLEENGALEPDSKGFLDLRTKQNGGPTHRNIDAAILASDEFLRSLSDPHAEFQSITTGIALRLESGVMLPEATLILDVLSLERHIDGRVRFQVGEIKVFPDRGGYTDSGHLSSARAQAGVYKYALEEWIEKNDLEDSMFVDDVGFLVFTRPGSNWPRIRVGEDFREQAARARRGFAQLDGVARRVVGVNAEDYEPAEYLDWVAHSETAYREECWTFCDLAPRCQDLALEQRRGILLGTDVARQLGETTLDRAIELLDGAIPRTEHEETLKAQLREADWN
jgi:hypothetical protein